MEACHLMTLITTDINQENSVRIRLCVAAEDTGHWEFLVPCADTFPLPCHVLVEICSVFWIFVEEVPELYIVGVEKRTFILWPRGELMKTNLTHVLR